MLKKGDKLIFKRDARKHNWVNYNATPLFTPNKVYTIVNIDKKYCYIECDDKEKWFGEEHWFTIDEPCNSYIWNFFYTPEEMRAKKLQQIDSTDIDIEDAQQITHTKDGVLILADCMDILYQLPDKSVQLILADLPYGVTDLKWDNTLDLDELWIEYKRIIKDNGCVILHATQPFATHLINSNSKWFKYEYIWIKTQASNFQLAKKMPLKKHENVLVFYNNPPIYNPQMTKGEAKMKRIGKNKYQDRKNDMYLSSKPSNLEAVKSDTYYPTTILEFPQVAKNKSQHPTQKSVELAKFLIKTYTNENDLVLDNTMGVGTTCIAAKETNRKFIGIEIEEKYYNIAVKRFSE